jgi:23S rRNA (adenine2503-C2)-methyltransferase
MANLKAGRSRKDGVNKNSNGTLHRAVVQCPTGLPLMPGLFHPMTPSPPPPPLLHLQDIEQRLQHHGALPQHTLRVMRQWVRALPQDAGRCDITNFLPQAVRGDLPALQVSLAALATVQERHPAPDGSERLLVALQGGNPETASVESVLLPRGGLCVSTQVGCAVGCVFCMTGQSGLLRQLGSAEIVAQLVLARQIRPVKKVVFMGMGEPAHNLQAVLAAIQFMGTAGGIGHKNIVFSTVGDPRAFERLMALANTLTEGTVKPALALSLHTTNAALRTQLLPRAPRITPAELVAYGEQYARASGYPIQYQWTLMEGVNDSEAELDALVALLRGKYALMNMIPFNAVPGMPWRRPSWARAAAIARSLHQRGILTKLRQSAGQDVEGGCGQLRARSVGERGTIPIAVTN